MVSTVRLLVLLIVLVLALPNLNLAQRTTATFAGIVQDPSGAVLPGVEASLINEGTSAVLQTVTNETGEFLIDFVPPGTYTLKLALPGFKGYESRSIPLGAAQSVRRTYTLEVGSITDNVKSCSCWHSLIQIWHSGPPLRSRESYRFGDWAF